MEVAERHRRILEEARGNGRVEVKTLCAALSVSVETVRRDLRLLEQHGLLQRTHGGAYPVENASYESALSDRGGPQVEAKQRIARAAVGLLADASSIFLDEGVTPVVIASMLPVQRQLTVLTASLPVAMEVAGRPDITLILLGGRVRANTLGAVGSATTGMLNRYVVDLAYIGANGVTRGHGLTTPDPAVADVKAQAIRSSRRRILFGVHEKFGIDSFCRFGDIKDFEAIVSDDGLALQLARQLGELGPQVLRV